MYTDTDLTPCFSNKKHNLILYSVAPSSDIDIFQAVKQVNMSMLTEVIKKHKVSVTVTDKDGATPLMYAARKGNVEVTKDT